MATRESLRYNHICAAILTMAWLFPEHRVFVNYVGRLWDTEKAAARLIYYFAVSRERILLLDIYAKNEKIDLTRKELRELNEVVLEWTRER